MTKEHRRFTTVDGEKNNIPMVQVCQTKQEQCRIIFYKSSEILRFGSQT
jgi:hypothetical protein